MADRVHVTGYVPDDGAARLPRRRRRLCVPALADQPRNLGVVAARLAAGRRNAHQRSRGSGRCALARSARLARARHPASCAATGRRQHRRRGRGSLAPARARRPHPQRRPARPPGTAARAWWTAHHQFEHDGRRLRSHHRGGRTLAGTPHPAARPSHRRRVGARAIDWRARSVSRVGWRTCSATDRDDRCPRPIRPPACRRRDPGALDPGLHPARDGRAAARVAGGHRGRACRATRSSPAVAARPLGRIRPPNLAAARGTAPVVTSVTPASDAARSGLLPGQAVGITLSAPAADNGVITTLPDTNEDLLGIWRQAYRRGPPPPSSSRTPLAAR